MKKIIVSIVEDNEKDVMNLKNALARYENEHGDVSFETRVYPSAIRFLDKYVPCDIAFMDIEMPSMDGMEASKELRTLDSNVAIVFVTNMAQYAIEGYSVSAFDFVVKPFTYASFSVRLDRLTGYLKKRTGKQIEVKVQNNVIPLALSDIKYVDIYNYRLIYHTTNGDVEVTTKSLQDVEPYLLENGFYKCSRSLIVNLRYVKKVTDSEITVGEDVLLIARRRKKDFLKVLTEYYGEENF